MEFLRKRLVLKDLSERLLRKRLVLKDLSDSSKDIVLESNEEVDLEWFIIEMSNGGATAHPSKRVPLSSYVNRDEERLRVIEGAFLS